YPALGPGQLWEEVARQIVEMGGEIHHYQSVTSIDVNNTEESVSCSRLQVSGSKVQVARGNNISESLQSEVLSEPEALQHETCNMKQVRGVTAINTLTNEETVYNGDYFFSTMPVQELIAGMNGEVPQDVKEVAAGLQYRDFITVGVLLQRLASTD